MQILFQWSMRVLRENPRHMLITLINLIFNFSLLTCTDLYVNNMVRVQRTDGDGMLWYLALLLCLIVTASSALTMYNVFSINICERIRRYRLMMTCGATRRQIRGSLFLEAVLLTGAGALLGAGMGKLLYSVTQTRSFDPHGLQYLCIPARGLHFFVPAFLAVLCAMDLAASNFLPGKSRKRKTKKEKPRTDRCRSVQPFRSAVFRVFGIGGELGRLMLRREKKRRMFFLSAMVLSITAQLLMVNSFPVFLNAEPIAQGDLCLSTSGDDPAFEQKVDEYLLSEAFTDIAGQLTSFRRYMPRAYLELPENTLTPQGRRAQRSAGRFPRTSEPLQIFRTKSGGRQIILPQMVFLEDAMYDKIAAKNGVDLSETDALLLRDMPHKGKTLAWLPDSIQQTQPWTLHFYRDGSLSPDQNQTRYRIGSVQEDARSVSAKNHLTYVPDADAFLCTTEPLQRTDIEMDLCVVSDDTLWDIDHTLPTLLLPERARASFLPLLDGAFYGRHLEIFARQKETDFHGQDLRNALCTALSSFADGYIAEHPFGAGTRYLVLGNGDLSYPGAEFYSRPLSQFWYTAPQHIYADLYPDAAHAVDYLGLYLNMLAYYLVFIGLMLFTLMTNIINTVYAGHVLRRREHAMLQSIGMDSKQKRSLSVYEAARYSMRSILCSAAGVLALYAVLSYIQSYGLDYEKLRVFPEDTAWTGYFFADAANALRMSCTACLRSWWVFVTLGALVFILYMLSNRVVRRHVHVGEVVPLLKKDI